MNKIKVGIIGAGGYGGCGAIEILIEHPEVELCALMAKHETGKPVSDIYPHLRGFCDLMVFDPSDSACPGDFDVVFYATPDGVGQQYAKGWTDKGIKVIDYSGDFRFDNPGTYKNYAERIGRTVEHASPQLLSKTVYGLAELHRDEIKKASIVGNPGCFAVSCILGLAPAVKASLIDLDSIICDAKTGVSGAGKTPKPTFHYPARYDAINAYKISGHQHVYEIERELGIIAGKEIKITFTPHVVPLTRGILSTIYGNIIARLNVKEFVNIYKDFYKESEFIRVFGPETPLASTDVRGSNFCNLSINVDKRTGKLIVVSLIDNLMKGQAGSAVQNMNLMFGLDETTGLLKPGRFP
ncbi:MAG: N-acetyl-gamma-glutamyl-phosphate reductase [Deltaproteobacteria bacterium]|nr:N-acetyl-gamma-glutamyl-phosphate reductase [Deltaproteobacteria bacterium]